MRLRSFEHLAVALEGGREVLQVVLQVWAALQPQPPPSQNKLTTKRNITTASSRHALAAAAIAAPVPKGEKTSLPL